MENDLNTIQNSMQFSEAFPEEFKTELIEMVEKLTTPLTHVLCKKCMRPMERSPSLEFLGWCECGLEKKKYSRIISPKVL